MTISEERLLTLQREREEAFAGKTKTKLQLSLRTHRGILTKLLTSMEGCSENLEAIPSGRCAEELTDVMDKSEAKVDDIEYGYNVLQKGKKDTESTYKKLRKGTSTRRNAQAER